MDLKPLHQRAANQHGLITRFQAAELGISKSQWHPFDTRHKCSEQLNYILKKFMFVLNLFHKMDKIYNYYFLIHN